MESALELESALRALQLQVAEGVDEWVMPEPQSRFVEAERALEAKAASALSPTAPSAPQMSAPKASTQTAPETPADFSKLTSEDAILDAMFSALPQGLQSQLEGPVPALGELVAEAVVVTDPPFREAVAKGNLEGDESIRLLLKSLDAIDLNLDAWKGREPRARARVLPISPWRMPQDRKFVEAEAKIFREALEARVSLGAHKFVMLAGSNLGNIELGVEEGRLFGLPTFELVSPRAMLREPLLKRVHWQRLLDLHAKLDGLLAI